MVGRNATFKFFLDIKDFITKGKAVVRTTNQINQTSTQASASMDKMAMSTQRAGQTSAAAAINFQTATQGMLNLSTAGIQTFTSFSNLDRAGNRLAQSQIGVARAQDLLSAKELRLAEQREKSTPNLRKIAQLEQEIATAKADLIVKNDKLKIEEGALLDIQLLFVANIANVMISSIQTITTLRNLEIGATIKQIIQQKLLARAYTTTSVSTVGYKSALGGVVAAQNAATISARGLLVALGPIGLAIGAVSVGVLAYQENWLGFGDAVKEVLPFLKDKKETLNQINKKLGESGEGWKGLTNTVRSETQKQTELIRFWRSKTIESIRDVNTQLASTNVFGQAGGGQQANPSNASVIGGGGIATARFLSGLNIFLGRNKVSEIVNKLQGGIGSGAFNPNTGTFNPVTSTGTVFGGFRTQIKQDELGRITKTRVPFSTADLSNNFFEQATTTTVVERFQQQLTQNKSKLDNIDQQILEAEQKATQDKFLNPESNAVLIGLRKEKDLLLATQDRLEQLIFDEQNRKTDSDFKFTGVAIFGGPNRGEAEIQRADNLLELANIEFTNSELFRFSNPARAQKHNEEGRKFARQASEAALNAKTKSFEFGTNTGRANRIAEISRIYDQAGLSASNFAASQLGTFGIQRARKTGLLGGIGSIGGQADAAIGAFNNLGGVNITGDLAIKLGQTFSGGGVPSSISKGGSSIAAAFAGRGAARNRSGGHSVFRGDRAGGAFRLARRRADPKFGFDLLGRIGKSFSLTSRPSGSETRQQAFARFQKMRDILNSRLGRVGVIRKQISELIPLQGFIGPLGNITNDLPTSVGAGLGGFESSLDELRAFREEVLNFTNLSFEQQSQIELNLERQRNELRDRVNFGQRLESASTGTSGI